MPCRTVAAALSIVAVLLPAAAIAADKPVALEARLAQRGPGSRPDQYTMPAGQSMAFHTHVYVDGHEVATTVTKHQRKDGTRRTDTRRGPYAGRH